MPVWLTKNSSARHNQILQLILLNWGGACSSAAPQSRSFLCCSFQLSNVKQLEAVWNLVEKETTVELKSYFSNEALHKTEQVFLNFLLNFYE